MKRIYFLIIVISLLSSALLAKSTEKDIEKIKMTTSRIDSELSTYTRIEQNKDSDGSRFSYLKNGDLMKVSIETRHDNMDKKVVWYFDNAKLIYSEQKWIDSNNNIVNNEKLFLSGNQLISWIKTDGQDVDKESDEFKNTEMKLIEYANSLKQAIE